MGKIKLYLDFDGVIWDTWPHFYKIIREISADLYEKMIAKKLTEEENDKISDIFRGLDWKKIIKESKPLNNSIECIKKLQELDIFDISILTHCNSLNEVANKTSIIEELLPGIKIIPVMKPDCKTSAVDPRGAILVDDYWKNLVAWEQAGGIPIKFAQSLEKGSGFYTISCLSQIPEVLKQMEEDELELDNVKTL